MKASTASSYLFGVSSPSIATAAVLAPNKLTVSPYFEANSKGGCFAQFLLSVVENYCVRGVAAHDSVTTTTSSYRYLFWTTIIWHLLLFSQQCRVTGLANQ